MRKSYVKRRATMKSDKGGRHEFSEDRIKKPETEFFVLRALSFFGFFCTDDIYLLYFIFNE